MKQELIDTCLQRDTENISILKYKRGNSIVSHTENKTIEEDTHPYIKMKKIKSKESLKFNDQEDELT
jgi:hypothetical protein